jgi:uncharacterized membrane protein YphA (DoxX/SURF4 family)
MADAKGRARALTLRSDANLRCSSNLPTIRSLCNTWNGRHYFAGSQSYFTSLKLPAPALLTWVTLVLELLVSAGLILGIGTRYAAILMFVFVVVATAIGHRYWEYPVGPQQIGQYNNFLKNISIMGGALAIFVTGAGLFHWIAYWLNSSLRGCGSARGDFIAVTLSGPALGTKRILPIPGANQFRQ